MENTFNFKPSEDFFKQILGEFDDFNKKSLN